MGWQQIRNITAWTNEAVQMLLLIRLAQGKKIAEQVMKAATTHLTDTIRNTKENLLSIP
jgi:hypothetical protein